MLPRRSQHLFFIDQKQTHQFAAAKNQMWQWTASSDTEGIAREQGPELPGLRDSMKSLTRGSSVTIVLSSRLGPAVSLDLGQRPAPEAVRSALLKRAFAERFGISDDLYDLTLDTNALTGPALGCACKRTLLMRLRSISAEAKLAHCQILPTIAWLSSLPKIASEGWIGVEDEDGLNVGFLERGRVRCLGFAAQASVDNWSQFAERTAATRSFETVSYALAQLVQLKPAAPLFSGATMKSYAPLPFQPIASSAVTP